MATRLENKVVFVSGGARGMGAAHARGVVAEGGSVVIGDVLADEGRKVAADLGDRALFVELDVTSEDNWTAAVQAAEEHFGGLDVLVNNAGITFTDIKGIVDLSLDEYMRMVSVNQVGTFLGMHVAALPIMRRGGGSIVNISSVAGLKGGPGGLAYTASKFAVCGMTKCAAIEFAPFNVRVNSVHPGLIRTPMIEIEGFETAAMAKGVVPLGRVAEPEEVTNLVLFLASSDSSYCTGAEFVIDGGVLCGVDSPTMSQMVTEQIRSRL